MKKLVYIAIIPLLLAACGDDEQQAQQPVQQQEQAVTQQVQPQQPIIVQSVPAQSSGIQDMLIGGLIGHTLASGGSQQHTIVNKTIINRTYVAPRQEKNFRSRSSYSSRRR